MILGLYSALSGPFATAWELVVGGSLILVPVLSVVLLVRLAQWSWLRILEIFVLIATWAMYLYNVSFFRG